MNLFVFGLGYSALHYVRTRRGAFTAVDGTVREEAKAAALRQDGIGVHLFSGAQGDPAVAARLARADVCLVSIPPDRDGDPVLTHYRQAIAAAPRLRTIVYLSTVGVYGDHGGAWVDETTPPRPVSARSAERLAAETGWLVLGEAPVRTVHVLRLGGIYGGGRNVLAKLRDGTARRLVKPGQVFNRIHVEDIGRAIAAALARSGPGSIYNVTDDEPAPPQDVVAYAAGLLGLPVPPAIDFATAELPAMARSFYGENKRVANGKLKSGLGVELAYPTYREGLRALYEAGEGT